MSNSSLVVYKKISPCKTRNRRHKIDTITIHCMAGNLTVERCGAIFTNPLRMASSNYGVGSDGRVALYVDEKDRSWASSNAANDNRAVTIEVANDGGANTGWHVSNKAYKALIDLVADICKRNGIKELKWKADKSLIGQVDKQNMTVHRWFKNKACPGDYLYSHMGDIAKKVNAKLSSDKPTKKSSDMSHDASPTKEKAVAIKKGDKVKVKAGSTAYDGKKLSSFIYKRVHVVNSVSGDRAVISYNGVIVAAVKVNTLTKA